MHGKTLGTFMKWENKISAGFRQAWFRRNKVKSVTRKKLKDNTVRRNLQVLVRPEQISQDKGFCTG